MTGVLIDCASGPTLDNLVSAHSHGARRGGIHSDIDDCSEWLPRGKQLAGAGATNCKLNTVVVYGNSLAPASRVRVHVYYGTALQ